MSTTTTIWTAEMLERMPDDGRQRELLRGELIEMSPGNSTRGYLIILLGNTVGLYAHQKGLGKAFSDTGFLLERGPDTVLAPDVSFIRKDRLAEVSPLGFVETCPDLAIEILSPSNSATEVLGKLETYLRSGVSAVWVLDPRRERAEIHRPGQPALRLGLDDTLEDEDMLPGFRITLRELLQD